jgi:hypothetical protein
MRVTVRHGKISCQGEREREKIWLILIDSNPSEKKTTSKEQQGLGKLGPLAIRSTPPWQMYSSPQK